MHYHTTVSTPHGIVRSVARGTYSGFGQARDVLAAELAALAESFIERSSAASLQDAALYSQAHSKTMGACLELRALLGTPEQGWAGEVPANALSSHESPLQYSITPCPLDECST